MKKLIDTKEYWEQRLRSFCNLEGVGCIGLGSFFNSYVYRAKVRTLEKVSKKHKISFKDKEVLDVGSGVGFWIDYYLSKGAKLIYGVDISSVAVKYLTEKYEECNINVKLFEGDFSRLTLDESFDIVNVFDVAYHVVDDKLFVKFVENCCKHLKNHGYLFITDRFRHDYRSQITYTKFRPLNVYRKVLDKAKVKIVSLVPMYSILTWPYTGKPRLDECLTFLYSLSLQLYKRFKPVLNVVYCIDSALTRFNTFGINAKLLVGQKNE